MAPNTLVSHRADDGYWTTIVLWLRIWRRRISTCWLRPAPSASRLWPGGAAAAAGVLAGARTAHRKPQRRPRSHGRSIRVSLRAWRTAMMMRRRPLGLARRTPQLTPSAGARTHLTAARHQAAPRGVSASGRGQGRRQGSKVLRRSSPHKARLSVSRRTTQNCRLRRRHGCW